MQRADHGFRMCFEMLSKGFRVYDLSRALAICHHEPKHARPPTNAFTSLKFGRLLGCC